MNSSLNLSTKKVIKPYSLKPTRKTRIEIFHFYEKFIVAAQIVVFVLSQITIKFEIVISWNTYFSVKWQLLVHVEIMRIKITKLAVVQTQAGGL